MKFLLDEMLSPQIGERLICAGIDAQSTRDVGLLSRPDRDVCKFAIDNGYVLVTADYADFLPILAESGTGHPGVVFVSTNLRRSISATTRQLKSLASSREQIDGQIRWLIQKRQSG